MTDLDTGVSGHFSPKVFSSAAHLVKVTDMRCENIHLIKSLAFQAMGFQDIMQGATIDAKIFTPCGFSLNALFEVCPLSLFKGDPPIL